MLCCFFNELSKVYNESMKINKEWHLANKMPKNATLEQRIRSFFDVLLSHFLLFSNKTLVVVER